MDGSVVQLRVIMDNPSQFTKDTSLSGYTKGNEVNNTRMHFEKWFENSVRVIRFDQQTDWEQPVRVASRVDLKGMGTSNLRLPPLFPCS